MATTAAVGYCGACGASLVADASSCPRCGRPVSAPRPPTTGSILSHGVVRAGVLPTAARIALDLAGVAWLVALGVLASPVLPGAWLPLALVAVGAWVVAARSGRTPAAVLLHQRVVRRGDHVAPGALRTIVPAGTITADLRHGLDPFAAPPLPPQWADAYAALPADIRPDPRRPHRRGGRAPGFAPITLALDSGQQVSLTGIAVVGRNPVDLDVGVRAVAWPDLSRTLSKNHARIEWDGSALWVTDLASTNGSTFAADGVRQPLPALQRVAVPVGATVSMGDRSLTVLTAVGERS